MRKILALIMALAVILSLATTAFAEDEATYTITISSKETDHIYEAYQIFKGTLSKASANDNVDDTEAILTDVQWGDNVANKDELPSAESIADQLTEGTLTLLPGPAQLDRHALGGGFSRCTEHLDLRWVAVAAPGAVPVVSEESEDVAWWPVSALPGDTDASLRSLVEIALD